MRRSVSTAVLMAGLVLSACATAGSGSAGGSSSNVITSEELRALEGVSSAYDAVQRLRPRFLRGRTGTFGTGGANDPLSRTSSAAEQSTVVVYLDGVRFGGIDALRRINVDGVREIRFVPGRDATTKYGTNHGGGVIEVSTR